MINVRLFHPLSLFSAGCLHVYRLAVMFAGWNEINNMFPMQLLQLENCLFDFAGPNAVMLTRQLAVRMHKKP